MKRLDGNNLLIIHPDKVYFETFVQEAEERGSNAFGSCNLTEAKKMFEIYDFDIIICFHTLGDGTAIDMLDWIMDEGKELKTFSVGCPPGQEKLYKDKFTKVVQEKGHLSRFLDDIHFQLFNFEKKTFVNLVDSGVIEAFICLKSNHIPVQTVEMMEGSISLTCEEKFEPNASVKLEISIMERGRRQNHTFVCALKTDEESIKTFEITPTHLTAWKDFVSALEQGQQRVTSYLKKAAGH